MKLNPVETMPLDTLIGVYGTVLNETNRDFNEDPTDNMGQHFCFGYARKTYEMVRYKRNRIIFPRKKKYLRRVGEIEFNVSPCYFYYLNVVNIVGWFHPPSI